MTIVIKGEKTIIKTKSKILLLINNFSFNII